MYVYSICVCVCIYYNTYFNDQKPNSLCKTPMPIFETIIQHKDYPERNKLVWFTAIRIKIMVIDNFYLHRVQMKIKLNYCFFGVYSIPK